MPSSESCPKTSSNPADTLPDRKKKKGGKEKGKTYDSDGQGFLPDVPEPGTRRAEG